LFDYSRSHRYASGALYVQCSPVRIICDLRSGLLEVPKSGPALGEDRCDDVAVQLLVGFVFRVRFVVQKEVKYEKVDDEKERSVSILSIGSKL
jgi:hypothetical protein